MEFQPPVRYATGVFPHGIGQGDLNHDGVLDLVIANNCGASLSVFLGQANGNFTKQADYTVGSGPVSPTVAKLNADAFPDLAVANGSGTTVSVLLGQADGTLGAKTDFTVGSRPTSIAVGDFNKDGFLDLVTANNGSTNVSNVGGAVLNAAALFLYRLVEALVREVTARAGITTGRDPNRAPGPRLPEAARGCRASPNASGSSAGSFTAR